MTTSMQASDCALQDALIAAWARAGRCSYLPVEGASMRPLLRPGDQVQVAWGAGSLKAGDIVVYRRGETLIVHRLLYRRSDGMFILGGDNKVFPDEATPMASILGIVNAVQRGERRIDLSRTGPSWLGQIMVATFPVRRWFASAGAPAVRSLPVVRIALRWGWRQAATLLARPR